MNRLVISLREAETITQVGGKAASLGNLIRSGLPVPDGFVISVTAAKEHAARAFRGLTAGAGDDERARAILATSISDDLRNQFVRAFETQIGEKAAVRSSATAEDASEASFAGQFFTALDVENAEAALDAVRSCWASLWSAHAAAYASKRTPSDSQAGMGVIVQRMINPRLAGVSFSEDPVTASNEIYYAEWVSGTGEALVSGSDLAGRAWFDRTGLVHRGDYLQVDAVPEPEMWKQLAYLLAKVCRVCGDRQDVEFAWTNGALILLQARPITIAREEPVSIIPPPWRLAGYPPGGWSEMQRGFFDCWDEYNPPQVPPLEFALWMGAIWQASVDMLDFVGTPSRIEYAVVVIDAVPMQIDPTCNQNGQENEIFHASAQEALESALDKAEREIRLIEAEEIMGPSTDNARLIASIASAAAIYREVVVTRLLSMQRWIQGEKDAKASLESLLKPIGIEVSGITDTLTAGADHETHRMLQGLRELAQVSQCERQGGAWAERLEEFLRRFGHFEGVALSDARQSILDQIDQLANAAGVEKDPIASARLEAHNLAADLRGRLATPEQRTAFDAAVAALERWIILREDSKTRQDRPLPFLRSLIFAAGDRLAKRGILRSPSDVNLLSWSELKCALAQGEGPGLESLKRRQAWLAWKATQSWLPDGFFGDKHSSDAPILHGICGSGGVAVGPARRIRGPEQFGEVKHGDVVVARTTNPLWTQLFSRIAAIVVENGSRLSHAAIVAREFRIPSVVAVTGVMSVIQDGEQLQVDGTRGEVRRLAISSPPPCAST